MINFLQEILVDKSLYFYEEKVDFVGGYHGKIPLQEQPFSWRRWRQRALLNFFQLPRTKIPMKTKTKPTKGNLNLLVEEENL